MGGPGPLLRASAAAGRSRWPLCRDGAGTPSRVTSAGGGGRPSQRAGLAPASAAPDQGLPLARARARAGGRSGRCRSAAGRWGRSGAAGSTPSPFSGPRGSDRAPSAPRRPAGEVGPTRTGQRDEWRRYNHGNPACSSRLGSGAYPADSVSVGGGGGGARRAVGGPPPPPCRGISRPAGRCGGRASVRLRRAAGSGGGAAGVGRSGRGRAWQEEEDRPHFKDGLTSVHPLPACAPAPCLGAGRSPPGSRPPAQTLGWVSVAPRPPARPPPVL